MQQVFEKISSDGFVLVYSLDAGTFYTLNFQLLQTFESNQKITLDSGLSVVEFSKNTVTVSNNQNILLQPTDFSTIASMLLPDLLTEIPKLKSKCERQEELLLDYRQRLGITNPAFLEKKKKASTAHRDLLNPRVKKPTTNKNIERGFLDE